MATGILLRMAILVIGICLKKCEAASVASDIGATPTDSTRGQFIWINAHSGINVTDDLGTVTSSTHKRAKRYTLSGKRWNHTDITYNISKYWDNFAKSDLDREIARAFHDWSNHINLTFRKIDNGKVDIDVRFESGNHDHCDIYGTNFSGVLGHAEFPNINGAFVHIFPDYNWTINSTVGVDVYSVAAHEIGHTLGLYHSEYRSSIMRPDNEDARLVLDKDTIQGIQAIYQTETSTTAQPITKEDPNLCTDGQPLTVFRYPYNDLDYIYLRGDFHWLREKEQFDESLHIYIAMNVGPDVINEMWQGLPGNIDAAFADEKEKFTYFFKGSKYWVYLGRTMSGGYPKMIKDRFPGIPNNIDAAIWAEGPSRESIVFFHKGEDIWSFNMTAIDSTDNPTKKLSKSPYSANHTLSYANNTYSFRNVANLTESLSRINNQVFKVTSGCSLDNEIKK